MAHCLGATAVTGSLYLLPIFIQFPFPQSPASGNHKSDLFFYEFACFWSIIDLLVLVPVTKHNNLYFYTFQNDHIVGHHTKILCSHCSVPRTLHSIPVTHIFCHRKFVPSNLSHLFVSSSPYHSGHPCLFSVSMTLFLFCIVCSFVLFFRFHIQVKF